MRGSFVIVGVSLGVLGLAACNTPRERLPDQDGSMAVETDGGTGGGTGGTTRDGGGAMDGGGGMGGMPVMLTPAKMALDPLSKDLSTIVIGHYAEATFQ